MFAFASRSLMRRMPAVVAAAAGGAAFAVPQFHIAHCDERAASFRSSAATGKGCPVSVGRKFLQMYFAENMKDGAVDLHKSLNFLQASHTLEAAGAKSKDVKAMFEMMDTDNSNSVDFVEIIAYFCNHGQGTLQDKASLFFHACDVDGSQTIEKGELKDVVHHMMLLKKETDGKGSFMDWNKTLYMDIPESFVFHFKANEFVNDVFAGAAKGGEELTEKDFQKWLLRGGKQVDRLAKLFGL